MRARALLASSTSFWIAGFDAVVMCLSQRQRKKSVKECVIIIRCNIWLVASSSIEIVLSQSRKRACGWEHRGGSSAEDPCACVACGRNRKIIIIRRAHARPFGMDAAAGRRCCVKMADAAPQHSAHDNNSFEYYLMRNLNGVR